MAAYGLTMEQVRAMGRKQRGLCAICRVRPWAEVDHCHTHGHVRGLLCRYCNQSLVLVDSKPQSTLNPKSRVGRYLSRPPMAPGLPQGRSIKARPYTDPQGQPKAQPTADLQTAAREAQAQLSPKHKAILSAACRFGAI
ncbi:MAG: endonuclease domain-containing protein [Gemmatimonadales bacterium]